VFNATVSEYIIELNSAIDTHQTLIVTLSFSMYSAVCFFFTVIAIPIFIRVNSIRKKYWQDIWNQMKLNGLSIQVNCVKRLGEIH
jgi:hypothetical protein